MPSLEQLMALGNAPASVILVVLGALILLGAVKGWWVPGWLWRTSEDRMDKVVSSVEKLSTLVENLADDLAWNDRDRGEVPRRRPRV